MSGGGRKRLQQGCPSEGLRYVTDWLAALRVRSHLAHETASVLKPLRPIVGELMTPRGNKVFQVVTPAR
ncbi:IclR-ED domain-containing protein [Burkholderia ambifaria]